jgi:serine/threonine protein kinase
LGLCLFNFTQLVSAACLPGVLYTTMQWDSQQISKEKYQHILSPLLMHDKAGSGSGSPELHEGNTRLYRLLTSLPHTNVILQDNLTLQGKIGQGGYGEVYEGVYLNTFVAVKKFSASCLGAAGGGTNTGSGNIAGAGAGAVAHGAHGGRGGAGGGAEAAAEVDAADIVKSTVHELEITMTLRHPHVVQYLGILVDPRRQVCACVCVCCCIHACSIALATPPARTGWHRSANTRLQQCVLILDYNKSYCNGC